jgi:DNA-binding response OmpR family regulator
LLIPVHMADHDVIVEAVMAGAKAYIKKPASGTAIKRRAANNLIRSEGK